VWRYQALAEDLGRQPSHQGWQAEDGHFEHIPAREAKRMPLPRYFVSHVDLREANVDAREIRNVPRHLRELFDQGQIG